jgi:16S rRNA (uracil1498-N3)-methyltransferase
MRDKVHNLFYIPPEKVTGDTLILDGWEFHHLKNVLRKKSGDVLILTDGLGHRIEARILNSIRGEISAEIVKKEKIDTDPKVIVDLAIAPLKGTRTDLVIEKGGELGIRRFIFYISLNSVVKDISKTKIERYQKIGRSAMLQSQQYFLPKFDVRATITDLINTFTLYDSVLVADPSGSINIPLDKKKILFIVGPEGGFDKRELVLFIKAGAQTISLGVLRLRSETAVLAGIVKIQSFYKVI